MKPVDFFRSVSRWIYEDSGFRNQLRVAGLDSLDALTSRQLGDLVTEHRSSWVRRMRFGDTNIYVKTYDYPSWRDRWRGFGRNTRFAASRVRREWTALQWLSEQGFGGPRVLAVGERRTRGWLCRGVLVTEAWPGESMATLLPQLTEVDRTIVLRELRRFVQRLHAAGFRDRNLDLRNVLAQRESTGWSLAKIDSPRHRILPDADPEDALARADWTRLGTSLQKLGLAL